VTQNALDKDSASQYTILIQFTWGDSNVARYAQWNSDVAISGLGTFISEPTLEADVGLQHGGIEDKPSSVKISSAVEPIAEIVRGFAHAPVNVVVWQVDPFDPGTTLRELIRGDIGRVKKNPGGVAAIVKFTVVDIKSKLDTQIGLYTTPTCQWIFGDPLTCQYALAANTKACNITGYQTSARNEITVGGFSGGAPDLTNLRWARGYIDVDGLRIMIREVIDNGDGTADIKLGRIPPPSWDGATSVSMVPGCNKQLSTCRDIHDNEANFLAPGISIPAYNPVLATA
jgi:hypothetical protein